MTAPLVTTSALREQLDDPRLRIVDCRYRLGEPGAGAELYREGHIPGAGFLDVDRDLAAPPGSGGRHPLPAAEDFEAAVRREGIGSATTVIAYDEAGEGGAARLWWLLRHFGHDHVAILDGGLSAWREDGGPLRGGEEHVAAGDFTARLREDDAVAAEELALTSHPLLLLDARAPERYRGEVEPIDQVGGRIPGAANLPFGELAPGGRFLPAEELRARLEAAGATSGREVVAYCGSGVTACVLVFAAELAGLDEVRLYPGSWSEWSGLGLPVETGAPDARH